MRPKPTPTRSIILSILIAGCGGFGPSNARSDAATSSPGESPERSESASALSVGHEALISGVPSEDDAWRLLLDSVTYGDDAILGFRAEELPAPPPGARWLSTHLQARYVGTGSPHQRLAAADVTLYYMLESQVHETQVVAAWPSLEIVLARDEDRGLTFVFAVPFDASALILAWTAFGRPAGYQWNLPPRAVSSTPTGAPESHVAWPPSAAGVTWKSLEGSANFPVGTDYPDLRPPADILLAKVERRSSGSPCTIFLSLEGDRGGETYHIFEPGRASISLIAPSEEPFGSTSWTMNIASTSCGWTVEIGELGTIFGPHSLSVADFILRSSELGSDWDRLEISLTAAALQAQATVASLRTADPNVVTALDAALSPDWYMGNHYIEDEPATGDARDRAITAIALQDDLTLAQREALYRPFQTAIPFASLPR